MSNSYPNVFQKSCVKKLPCNKPSKCLIHNDREKKRIYENDRIHMLRERFDPISKIGVNLKNSCDDKISNKCIPYNQPSKLIKNNKINYSIKNSHSWSNQRGYGNIIVAKSDTCNNIHTKVKSYNIS